MLSLISPSSPSPDNATVPEVGSSSLSFPRKQRLDQWLVTLGLADTRTKAQAYIMAGEVYWGTQRLDKASHHLTVLQVQTQPLTLKNRAARCRYVSRGGLKLEGAFTHWKLLQDAVAQGRTWLDVGASTGGFTDCLLQHGAGHVVALDVGIAQLDEKLRQHPQVTVIEKCNARYLHDPQHLTGQPKAHLMYAMAQRDTDGYHGWVMDVSFISLKKIVPSVLAFLTSERLGYPQHALVLLKPQFEVLELGDRITAQQRKAFQGVVHDPTLQTYIQTCVLEDLTPVLTRHGWYVEGVHPCPITGAEGNQEFLVYLKTQ